MWKDLSSVSNYGSDRCALREEGKSDTASAPPQGTILLHPSHCQVSLSAPAWDAYTGAYRDFLRRAIGHAFQSLTCFLFRSEQTWLRPRVKCRWLLSKSPQFGAHGG
ncbi:hypothetical protein ILYODFUR_018383 [Ilyodon furcidens]|uniref:Uncharacterized protein n=1 Tax=Ilyodon furcidens TaxID=33524 RepID=A0ABV0SMY3_9TELE